MTNRQDFIRQLLTLLDPDYNGKMKRPFWLFQKRNTPNYYVEFTATKIRLSTGTSDYQRAFEIATEWLEHPENIKNKSNGKRRKTNDEFHNLINAYYKKDSEHLKRELAFGLKLPEKERIKADNFMSRITELTPDIHYFSDLTRPRLEQLQIDLQQKGREIGKGTLSGKTIDNYLTHLHRIYLYLFRAEKINTDPFYKRKHLKHEKRAKNCFEIAAFKHKLPLGFDTFNTSQNEIIYSLLGFIQLTTGFRNSEIDRITTNDIYKTDSGYWLHWNGTKTENAKRIIPITDLTARLIKAFATLKQNGFLVKENGTGLDENDDHNRRLLLYWGQFCGMTDIKEIKEDNGITFYGFRKMFKTHLQSVWGNTQNIEALMGHTTQNTQSNDPLTSYYDYEKADRTNEHNKVCEAMGYFETKDPMQLQLFNFWAYGIIERGLDIKRAWKLAKEAMEDTTLAAQINAALLEAKEKENTLAITEKERTIKRLDIKRKTSSKMPEQVEKLPNEIIDSLITTDRYKDEFGDPYWGKKLTTEEREENKKSMLDAMNEKE